MKIYVSKWAATRGVCEIEEKLLRGVEDRYRHTCFVEAQRRAEEIKRAAINNLEAQLERAKAVDLSKPVLFRRGSE